MRDMLGRPMTDDESMQLQAEVIEMCDELIARYDWDSAFSKYLEAQ